MNNHHRFGIPKIKIEYSNFERSWENHFRYCLFITAIALDEGIAIDQRIVVEITLNQIDFEKVLFGEYG